MQLVITYNIRKVIAEDIMKTLYTYRPYRFGKFWSGIFEITVIDQVRIGYQGSYEDVKDNLTLDLLVDLEPKD